MVLEQNFPNPFNPTTTIAFHVPDGGAAIELGVYNVAGERVRTLLAEEMSPGRKTVIWNGLNDHGERASSGVYFVRLTSDATKLTKKVVLLK
jgi:flagellar hook assembly protein FlgD